ncbi:MAG: hypothetical protein MJZ93_01770 [Paludibacteraceae bacterium]|nr:hypothetical protein [Paludibacteraceae bacterium]
MTRIGKFNKTHGVNGEINLMVEVPFDYEECKFILAEIDGLMVPFEIASVRTRGRNGLLVSFERMTQKILERLVNKDAHVDDEYVEEVETDEFNPAYYVGYKLIDKVDGREIGTIRDYDDSTENILFDVDGNLVPAGAIEVEGQDAEKKTMIVRLPEGLI